MRFVFLVSLFPFVFFLNGCANVSSSNPPLHITPKFQTVAATNAMILQKGQSKTSCVVCGMHLPDFYKTNHASVQKDGTVRQYCSLHCLVYDNEINKIDLYDVKVVDTATLKFIEAQSAFYVVGSNKPATMSHISKYAFEKRSDADAFAKLYGGNVMNFYDAYTVTMKDFNE